MDRVVHSYVRSHKRRSVWRSIVTAMAAVVVFCTTYALILPAITLEDKTCCGLMVHAHSDECYERALTCTQASGHTHSDSCYQAGQPICGCGDGAVILHSHTEGCYDENGQLICVQEAETVHTHTADCYGEKELACGLHQHSDKCYSSVLTCERTEHTHSLACYADATADVETPEIWEATLPNQRTNIGWQDILAVAKSQLTYQESTKNYTVVTDTGTEEMKGYTRYGHWYGQTHGDDPLAYAYQDWDALFVSFCLHYAGIPEDKLPRAATAGEWAALLESSGDFQSAAEYTGEDVGGPWEGDLAFFDTDTDGKADRMGIVSQRVFTADGYTMAGFLVIRGDAHSESQDADTVTESFCALDDPTLLGFARLPDRPDGSPMPLATTPATVERDPATGMLTYTPPVSTYLLKRFEKGFVGSTEGSITNQATLFLIYDSISHRLDTTPSDESIAYAIVNQKMNTDNTRSYLKVEGVPDVIVDSSTAGLSIDVFNSANINNALTWHFKTIEKNGNKFYIIYTTSESDGKKQYLVMTKNTDTDAHLRLTYGEADASYFTLEHISGSSFRLGVQFSDPSKTFNVVPNTVSPSNTKINVFDYWLVNQGDSDNDDPTTSGLSPSETKLCAVSGINNGKILKFRRSGSSLESGTPGYNLNTEPDGAYQGIVENTLTNGYPVVKNGDQYQSLAYLFDPASTDTVAKDYRQTIQNAQGLLQLNTEGYYVYDCKTNYACLQKDASGKYTNQFSVYDQWYVQKSDGSNPGQFYPFNPLYWEDSTGKHGSLIEDKAWQSDMNHYFGLTLTARFIQQYGGKTSTGGADTIFSFTGDDDVWIFIDDVLVADLGGIHDKVGVTINFRTGQVTVDKVSISGYDTAQPQTTTLRDAYKAAGKEDAAKWSTKADQEQTFVDGSVHTLKFFYLERGNGASNMKLQYNLLEQNASSIHKADQDGNPITGAEFKVYKATKDEATGEYSYYLDANGNKKAVYNGNTNSDGMMYFTDSEGAVYSSISKLFKNPGENTYNPYIILRETKVPDGYRTISQEAWLRLDVASGCVICDNVYDSGVWVRNNALVSICQTDALKVAGTYQEVAGEMAKESSSYVQGSTADGYTVNYYSTAGTTPNGTLFAVVLKKNKSTGDIDTWTPIYGSNTKGYHFVTGNAPVENAILAAQKQAELTGNGGVVFALSGAEPQLLMENLPGDITSYREVIAKNKELTDAEAKTEYAIEFFWTSGNLANADSTNTLRVEEPDTANPTITHTWGTTIEVPNMENRLFFQKMDPLDPNDPQHPDTEKLLNGATFALYHAIDAPSKTNPSKYYVYYKGYQEADTNTVVYVALLSDSKAEVFSNPPNGETSQPLGSGTYTIDPATGRITVTVTEGENQTVYHVEPATNAEGASLVDTTHDSCNFVAKEGTGHFNKLLTGEYCLREIKAPDGYELNPTDIPVVVNEKGVFAYAGLAGEKDDVSVGNGVGYVTKTLNVFAVPNGLDETLAWVQGKLIGNSSTGFEAFNAGATNWADVVDEKTHQVKKTYLVYDGSLAGNKEKLINIFDYASNPDRPVSNSTNPLLLLTDSGWSDLAIYQDNNHAPASSSNYVSLTGDISNLFSSSTFVRVTDTPKATVTKEVLEGTTPGQANDASIGDKVNFQITVSVEKPGATILKLTDSLDSEGALAYLFEQDPSNTARMNGWYGEIVTTESVTTSTTETMPFVVEYKAPVAAETEYTLAVKKEDGTDIGTLTVAADQRGFTVNFDSEFLKSIKNKTITNLTFCYTARLNYAEDDSTPGFINSAFLTYSGGQKEYETDVSETVTSTWKLPIFKYTGSGAAKTSLPGAQFTLKDAKGNPVKLGSKVTLGDGTEQYTVTAGGSNTEVVSGTNGLIEIRGLDSGTYTLTETKAPDGYHMLTHTIRIDIGEDGKINVTNDAPNGVEKVEVYNNPGYELPDTGGMGTTWFTICGLLMMAAAVGCGYGLRRGRERRAR